MSTEINLTPTWSAIYRIHLAVMENPNATPDAKRIVREEVARMADAADRFNARVANDLARIEGVSAFCDQTFNDGCASDPDLGFCRVCGYVFHSDPRDTDDAHDQMCGESFGGEWTPDWDGRLR